MSAHTPGPWAPYWDATSDSACAIVSCDNQYIFDVRCRQSVSYADARLIAAAPDLLEALLRMRDEVREFLPNVCGEALTQAEAAIAKARGTR